MLHRFAIECESSQTIISIKVHKAFFIHYFTEAFKYCEIQTLSLLNLYFNQIHSWSPKHTYTIHRFKSTIFLCYLDCIMSMIKNVCLSRNKFITSCHATRRKPSWTDCTKDDVIFLTKRLIAPGTSFFENQGNYLFYFLPLFFFETGRFFSASVG